MTEILQQDPVMAGLLQRYGPVTHRGLAPFPALVRSIVSQQISSRAADAILARLHARIPLEPGALASLDCRRLERVGLSRAKARYVRELARFAVAGGLEALESLPDAEVIARLTTVKGIGVWTAEMFLIFSLGRPDVWPVGDGGIQRAARQLYRIRTRNGLARLGERFRPWRSHAAWYLWRALDG